MRSECADDKRVLREHIPELAEHSHANIIDAGPQKGQHISLDVSKNKNDHKVFGGFPAKDVA